MSFYMIQIANFELEKFLSLIFSPTPIHRQKKETIAGSIVSRTCQRPDNQTVSRGKLQTKPLPTTQSPSDYVVRTECLQKLFKLPSGEVHALRGVDFSVKKGEMIAIMGPSGSGKTTLLNLIGTLDRPTRGRILIEDKDLTRMNGRQITDLRRKKIGFIFQSYNLIPVLSAFENVELPLLIAGVGRSERKRRAFELLEMVGLSDRADHQPDELSGGEQQRVATARALANHPSIILADEPTGDLDTRTGEEVMRMLREASRKEGSTVIVVTHDPNISALTDRVLFMKDGKIIGERNSDSLIQLIDKPKLDPYLQLEEPIERPQPEPANAPGAPPKVVTDDLPIYMPQPFPKVDHKMEQPKQVSRIVEWRGKRRMIRDSKGIICLNCGAYNFGENVKSCRICGEAFSETKPVSVSIED